VAGDTAEKMYESYPAAEPAPERQRIQPPNPVRNAVRLMYAGAALEVVALVVALLTRSSLKSAILTAHPGYTPAHVHLVENDRAVSLAVGAVITIGLWLWMAWANGRGRQWARVVSAVFFGINTVDLIISLVLVRSAPTSIVGIVIWLVGLAAIVLLFRGESGPYFRPRAG
jgi:hypothetical protein